MARPLYLVVTLRKVAPCHGGLPQGANLVQPGATKPSMTGDLGSALQ